MIGSMEPYAGILGTLACIFLIVIVATWWSER